jgi:hypothetical protein
MASPCDMPVLKDIVSDNEITSNKELKNYLLQQLCHRLNSSIAQIVQDHSLKNFKDSGIPVS